MVVDEKNFSAGKKIAGIFNNYFNNAAKLLNLKYDPENLNNISDENDPIEVAVKKFKNHPSIVNINKNTTRLQLRL